MQIICQLLRVGIVCLIKAHGIPTILAPILPILHNHIGRQVLATETLGCVDDFVLRMETLTAMNITQCPLRHQR